MHVELIYPIFLDASQHAEDTFWKHIFEDLAYGRTPYGTYIVKNFICCNYKNKEFSYKIDITKNGEQIYNELFNLLHNKFGLLSLEDKQLLRSKFDQTQEENSLYNNMSWTSIKKKNIKHLIIENFVIAMKKKYNLSNMSTRELLSYITIGLVFKTILPENIDYKNGKIYSIEGIDFQKGKIILDKNIFDFDVTNSTTLVSNKRRMSDNWEKYLSSFKKYRSFK